MAATVDIPEPEAAQGSSTNGTSHSPTESEPDHAHHDTLFPEQTTESEGPASPSTASAASDAAEQAPAANVSALSTAPNGSPTDTPSDPAVTVAPDAGTNSNATPTAATATATATAPAPALTAAADTNIDADSTAPTT